MKLQMTSFSSLVGVVQAGKIIIEEGPFFPPRRLFVWIDWTHVLVRAWPAAHY